MTNIDRYGTAAMDFRNREQSIRHSAWPEGGQRYALHWVLHLPESNISLTD